MLEKKKWVSITGLCNNHCIFCLDGERSDKCHKTTSAVKKEIREGIKSGATRLVLSGGDPTVHPELIFFISYGIKQGYKKIQIITNGRLLSYMDVVWKLKNAGLHEVTFSLHGHTEKLHDLHTSVKGSFRQIIQGIRNSQRAGLIVNTDTTITKINYRYLPKIIQYIHSLNISEVNLMSIVPFGRAWLNKKNVLYVFSKAMPYIKKTVDYCKKNNIKLWFSRIPSEYLEGYEKYIWDNKKVLEEIEGFSWKFQCRGEKCAYCSLKEVCYLFERAQKNPNVFLKKKHEIIIEITSKNYKKLSSIVRSAGSKKIVLVFSAEDQGFYTKNIRLKDIVSIIEKLMQENHSMTIVNIPQCFFKKAVPIDARYFVSLRKYTALNKVITAIVSQRKIKKEACKYCLYTKDCHGMIVPYIKAYGFKELRPIQRKKLS